MKILAVEERPPYNFFFWKPPLSVNVAQGDDSDPSPIAKFLGMIAVLGRGSHTFFIFLFCSITKVPLLTDFAHENLR